MDRTCTTIICIVETLGTIANIQCQFGLQNYVNTCVLNSSSHLLMCVKWSSKSAAEMRQIVQLHRCTQSMQTEHKSFETTVNPHIPF